MFSGKAENLPAASRTRICVQLSTHTTHDTLLDSHYIVQQLPRSDHIVYISNSPKLILASISFEVKKICQLTFIHRYGGIVLIPSTSRNRVASE